jgi:hypothetical protein
MIPWFTLILTDIFQRYMKPQIIEMIHDRCHLSKPGSSGKLYLW